MSMYVAISGIEILAMEWFLMLWATVPLSYIGYVALCERVYVDGLCHPRWSEISSSLEK